MILAVDIGNSYTKAGLFKSDHQLEHFRYSSDAAAEFSTFEWAEIFAPHEVKYIGIVSVGNAKARAIAEKLKSVFPEAKILAIDHQSSLPLENKYESPETLGMDRIVAAAGGKALAGPAPVLVIDAGTAITYEFVDQNGAYLGGAIAPGMAIRFKALNDYTARLPLLEADGKPDLVGKNTTEAIQSGVINGLIAEIDGIIDQYQKMAGKDLQVFLTGGDAAFLGNQLKNTTFVNSNLLLSGIKAIIRFQIEQGYL